MLPAIAKAVEDAKKNLVRIPLNGTLPQNKKVNLVEQSALIQLLLRTGVIAGGAVRAVLESVGVHDVFLNLKIF